MRNARYNHFHHRRLTGTLVNVMLMLMVLTGIPFSLSPRSDFFSMGGLIVAQTKDTLAIGRDGQTGDRMIMVSPPASGSEDSTMVIDRDQDTGDRIMHVAPPPEQAKGQDILIGPLFITPEVTWPDPRKPGKRQ